MHQPRYVHPVTRRPVLPWVRLHASSGYLDMARALERHPRARVTVNFVPSLVEQIESMLAGERDDLERIAEKHTDALDEGERALVSARSFSVRWNRCIEPRPRYAELLALRGSRAFRVDELRDLQCLFLLSWLGFAAREDEPAIGQLDEKGRGFSEDDKAVLIAAARKAAGAVLPAWRRLAERGQVELSTSPYYHPILPLLLDTEAARRSRPDDELPTRFSRAGDALEQIKLAQAAHERAFGQKAQGMWPPEGCLSPEAVALYGEAGVEWLASDEDVLHRSLDGEVPPRAKTRFWRHAGVDLVFRDRDLSDRIGFRYSDVPAAEAVADLLGGAKNAGDDGVVGIFLDGENAWEAYPRRGADFLDALYGALEREESQGKLRSRTIGEARAERAGGGELKKLWSGSWIDANFRIWIGDSDKNRAWALLGRARDRLQAAEEGGLDAGVKEAHRLLLAAEGSDWFWWFGEPFSSAEDPVFDELFRAHLAWAWRALGDDPPAELAEPIGVGQTAAMAAAPRNLITPHLDGKGLRFFEWHGAARHELGRGSAMAGTPHPVERVHVGFDYEHLYLRLDPQKAERRRVAAGRMVLHVRVGEHETALRIQLGAADGGAELAAAQGRVAALDVVELALPFARLAVQPRDIVRIWMTLEFAGVPFCRIPRDGVIALTAPWPGWEEENWSV
jgi:alpha-amylase/alpha-mannosidase (GH57 family)